MAVSAAAVTAKLVALTLSDRNGRTVFFSVIAALVTPVILIVTMILCTLSGTADHNISAVQLSFHGGDLSSNVPAEYRMYIENVQDSFEKLDGVLNEINGMAEAEEVDPYQVKAIFYALFFGKEYPRMDEGDYRAFADCFVEYEEREDEEGETYTVAIPIQSLNMVYGNLAAELNQEVSLEDKTNVQRIYMLAKYGVSVPGGNGLPPGQAMGDGSFSALMAEATRYIGYPYVKSKYTRRKIPPPYFAARYGNLQIFPRPTADPATASTYPIFPEKLARFPDCPLLLIEFLHSFNSLRC